MLRLFAASALLALALPVTAAQVYKWTDAQGTVHYSETPPAQGTDFSRIKPVTGAADAAPAPAAADPAEAAAETTPEPQPTAAELADTPENRQKLCSTLDASLTMLKGSGTLVMQQDGKAVVVDEAMRQAQLEKAQAQHDQYCGE